jgi:hypothetical protein
MKTKHIKLLEEIQEKILGAKKLDWIRYDTKT